MSPTPDNVSMPENSSIDSTAPQTSAAWIQDRGSTFSSRVSCALSDLASPAGNKNPVLLPPAEYSPRPNTQISFEAQNLAVRIAAPGAKGSGATAAAATPTLSATLDYSPNSPPKETSSKDKSESVPIIFLNGNDDEEAKANTTKLKHGSDPHKGEDYCQDDQGKKYNTAPRPTSVRAFSPCWFVAPVTPVPYNGTPSKTIIITDPKGTVWFCPSTTPNNLAVYSEYDCGPHSSSLPAILSITKS